MTIRILDCAPMSPWFPRWHIGGTCLLVDTDQGPVLVDTGLGLHDFPHAQVHVHRREYEAVQNPRTWIELAYDGSDFAHEPAWVLYEQTDAEWLGLEAIRLPFSPEMYFVPLFGHTRGHCGVAIHDHDGWLFHCADALPTNARFDLTPQ